MWGSLIDKGYRASSNGFRDKWQSLVVLRYYFVFLFHNNLCPFIQSHLPRNLAALKLIKSRSLSTSTSMGSEKNKREIVIIGWPFPRTIFTCLHCY